jgi:hypothetical protein
MSPDHEARLQYCMVLSVSRSVLCKWQHYQQLPKCQNHQEVYIIHHTFVTMYRNSQAITELSEHFKCSSVKQGKKRAEIPQTRHCFLHRKSCVAIIQCPAHKLATKYSNRIMQIS